MPQDSLIDMGVAEAVCAYGYRGGFVSKLMVERSLRGRGATALLMISHTNGQGGERPEVEDQTNTESACPHS